MTSSTRNSLRDEGDAPSVVVRRSRDADVIARILDREYSDEPIRSFPAGLKRAFAAGWCATRDDVYFVTAEVDGRPAGFVCGHAMGDGFVKLFGRRNPKHLPALVLTFLRLRLGPKCPTPEAAAVPADTSRVEAEFAALGIPNDARPFAWSRDERDARIALLFVGPEFRGHRLARRLLDATAEEMRASGVRAVEAHIDPYNISSVRAFLKSGYELRRMAGKDFFARRELAG